MKKIQRNVDLFFYLCAHAHTNHKKGHLFEAIFSLSNKNIQIQIIWMWDFQWNLAGCEFLLKWILWTETRWHTHTHTVTAKITKWFLFFAHVPFFVVVWFVVVENHIHWVYPPSFCKWILFLSNTKNVCNLCILRVKFW